MDEDQVQETTAGTGRLLFMFLGMVVLCAVFFGLGYSLGKNSGPSVAQAAEPTPTISADSSKPSPLNPGDSGSSQPTSSGQLTFYDAVGQKDSQPGLATKSAAPAGAKPEAAAPVSEEARLAAAVGMTPVSTAPAAGYTVQIAAVSRQGDADALVAALRKKQYPVFVAANAPDKLFHVQVGPFADRKEAEAMKARLVSDGYKPIVKK
jgi:cell division septation protein DedD